MNSMLQGASVGVEAIEVLVAIAGELVATTGVPVIIAGVPVGVQAGIAVDVLVREGAARLVWVAVNVGVTVDEEEAVFVAVPLGVLSMVAVVVGVLSCVAVVVLVLVGDSVGPGVNVDVALAD